MMQTKHSAFGVVFVWLVLGQILVAQSLQGHSGLVLAPTAEMSPDGQVTFGVHHMNGDALPQVINFDRVPGTYDRRIFYTRVGFLPFFEVTIRLTRFQEFSRSQAIGDRFIGLRLRLLKEGAKHPSVVMGVNDIYGTRLYHAFYIVASKALLQPRNLKLHVGYASTYFKARYYVLKGLFGGISVDAIPNLTLLLEHDSRQFNIGARVVFFRNKIRLIGGLQAAKKPYAGIGYVVSL